MLSMQRFHSAKFDAGVFIKVFAEAARGAIGGLAVRRNKPETVVKPDSSERASCGVRPIVTKRRILMIQVGSKEEVAFLLALFGIHTQPVRQPKPKSTRG